MHKQHATDIKVYTPDPPKALASSVWTMVYVWLKNHELLTRMIWRDVLERYRGSLLGLLWSFINPMVVLATYSFVFSVFFKMEAKLPDGRPFPFFIMLFCGLIPFQFFSEVISKSPAIILSAPNFVKRIAFPLELLPLASIGSALFHAGITMTLLLVATLIFLGGIPLTALWLPLVLLPLIIFTLGLSFLLSAAGVFIRDLGHTVGLLLNILFFMTPIVYPETMIPQKYHWIIFVNPVAYAVSNLRKTCLYGEPIILSSWLLFFAASMLFLLLAGAWFQSIRRRFADVI